MFPAVFCQEKGLLLFGKCRFKNRCKIPQLSEQIQENVKSAVQNMTCITVSKVNVIVNGVVQETSASVEEEE